MNRQLNLIKARLNWCGLMKRAWPNDPEVEERARTYAALYAELLAMDRRKLDALVKAKHPVLFEALS